MMRTAEADAIEAIVATIAKSSRAIGSYVELYEAAVPASKLGTYSIREEDPVYEYGDFRMYGYGFGQMQRY